jgi:hypothetical protein
MKLSDVKKVLTESATIGFQLPDGSLVPSHYHVTEVGMVEKNFIDCGGTIRKENVISFQLWYSYDYNHRIHPEKLLQIIQISESKLDLPDLEVEVEYQTDTIGKFALDYDGANFKLLAKQTDCLAKDNCGIPIQKLKVPLSQLQQSACCGEGSDCC